ncbi:MULTISPECIES: DNA topoisomerase IB [Chryseobacterium]|uniref:DNA topoisomerase n=1 Tax=Chryseobacterium camelliae TaxID=1265445 RepID=A0ABU0TIS9_9FLAO|nr:MULTISPECIES: DNA topoisomerase IB [Chryseobacterium]MDT3409177.1 DNA topoisomerase-1 [Pseudacidovorax intermedius]MDQ1096962.1 DNA topoisomerase-1 [Chryseobacterium camelliae]MDQ1100903.1 DNA topoisomerase-1 [Chryseobacterium sp. SORGH_AS_1048]MDR6084346.1 DNA topoisomerase-1 [Chryseobacterium sp. SORGH_AS_0909]MDR6132617.1 DNA topoisomerase-1 [Chryseobacterium sp. SORGH_AS_1175]
MENSDLDIISHLKPSKIVKIMKDPVASAKAVHLIYTSDAETAGIIRKKRGKKFSYYKDGEKIKDKDEISRINKLVLPPAWENVWICALDNGHLQATGIDAKKRKQYRYHPLWNALRNHTKFYRMLQFGYALPQIRLHIEQDLALRNLEKRKVLALIVSLMQRTNIRIGNSAYEKLYGSFGLTTLKDKHVKVKGKKLSFCFKGKKGVMHDIDLKSSRLSRLVQKCKDIPGKELFQYYDDDGNRHSIDSGMVNEYIKEISGEDFTAKDFRTWSGTVNALIAFKEIGYAETNAEYKKKVKEALDIVASRLGNTVAVCKKYYVHPLVINLYENNTIKKYLDELEIIEKNDGKADLTQEEKLVLKILESEKL